MTNWRDVLPIGFLLPFLVIILLEVGVSYGFDYLKRNIDSKITNLESQLKTREEGLADRLEKNDAYFVFSQVINIVEIIKNRRSPLEVVNKFTPLVPTFIKVQEVRIDMDNNEIVMMASVANLVSYLRALNYFQNHPKLELKNKPSPNISNEQVTFEMVFALKPTFFE
ncbi:MAG: hypothetical protein NZ822_01950 [Patescibacteria group bacterium]|nr:hypothetical protein [Patescibacteria group bacterium]